MSRDDGGRSRRAAFLVDDRLVQPDLNRISGGGRTVQVEPRLVDVLVRLAERPGEVVGRRELLDAVWSDTVVGEESLTRAIFELRQIFGDDPRAPRIIETIRKRGYRLVAPVRPAGADYVAEAPAGPDAAAVPVAAAPARAARRRGSWTARLLGAAAVAVLAAALVIIWQLRRPAPPSSLLASLPFTSFPGLELHPAPSPDGGRVAFAWNGPAEGEFDLYVKQRNTETPLQLTDTPENEVYPAWSPDGGTLAFIRRGAGEQGIFTVPAIGGEARRLYQTAGFLSDLDWSPDGRWLLFAEREDLSRPLRLVLLDAHSLEREVLTHPAPTLLGDDCARISPDGRLAAFIRRELSGIGSIFTVPLAGGEPRRLTQALVDVRGLAWCNGGGSIVFSTVLGGTNDLSVVSAAGGRVRRLPSFSEWILAPATARAADVLVYESVTFTRDIWRRPLGANGGEATPFIVSTYWDGAPRHSPDGSRVLFLSARTGFMELWSCRRDGSRLRQLTRLRGPIPGGGHWSPGGERIAFHTIDEGRSGVWVLDQDAAVPRLLHQELGSCLLSGWSRDGGWIYFSTPMGDAWRLWKIRATGGEPLPVPAEGAMAAAETPDGRGLLFTRPPEPGIWRQDFWGGPARRVVDDLRPGDFYYWQVMGNGLYYNRERDGLFERVRRDLDSGETRVVARLPEANSLTVSIAPDESELLFVRMEHVDVDLRLVEDFR
ncbi:MAG: PD40 domain-containing protein [Candidatus Krumholzibacteriota bacterium]|nr:PD40 domain-containing protein [Candidatus Krumholzibacteriota bacterium]